jgi:hypothetical protein
MENDDGDASGWEATFCAWCLRPPAQLPAAESDEPAAFTFGEGEPAAAPSYVDAYLERVGQPARQNRARWRELDAGQPRDLAAGCRSTHETEAIRASAE